ncbi:hypothetical protein MTR67_039372 [Solanum verrucosum]|uniref:Uncharacterized protein n=1 Tax=Solanum verrucosum TaxID=315347 RepID=A0AAF0UHA0_SOLVR|nr:hypothetical protein MTR67_039372 [Solanum verrucosum]
MKRVNREFNQHIYRVFNNYSGIPAAVILASIFYCSYKKATSPKSKDCSIKLVLVVRVQQKTLLGECKHGFHHSQLIRHRRKTGEGSDAKLNTGVTIRSQLEDHPEKKMQASSSIF